MRWKEWRELRQERRMLKTLEIQNDQVVREEIKEGIGDRVPFYVLKVRGLAKSIERDDLVKALGEQDSLIPTETKLVIKGKENKYNCAFVVYSRRLDCIKAWNVGKTWEVMARNWMLWPANTTRTLQMWRVRYNSGRRHNFICSQLVRKKEIDYNTEHNHCSLYSSGSGENSKNMCTPDRAEEDSRLVLGSEMEELATYRIVRDEKWGLKIIPTTEDRGAIGFKELSVDELELEDNLEDRLRIMMKMNMLESMIEYDPI